MTAAKVNVTAYLPIDLYQWLQSYANSKQISLSKAISEILQAVKDS